MQVTPNSNQGPRARLRTGLSVGTGIPVGYAAWLLDCETTIADPWIRVSGNSGALDPSQDNVSRLPEGSRPVGRYAAWLPGSMILFSLSSCYFRDEALPLSGNMHNITAK